MPASRPILFDVDGVVVHGYHALPEKRRRWDEHLQADLGIDPDAFTRLFIRESFERDVLTGRVSLVEALAGVLPTLGFSGSPLRVVDYWLQRDSQLNFPLLDLVRELRIRGARRLYLATNQEHLRALHLWSTLDLKSCFDDIFYSARLGALKPSIPFLDAVAQSLGSHSPAPLLFDDNAKVVASACAFGWEGVLFESLDSCLTHPDIRAILGR